MISVINVPSDSPKDFYASRRRNFTDPSPSTEINTTDSISTSIENNNNNNNDAKTTTKIPNLTLQRPFSCSIFYRRKATHQTEYLSDGRKVFDGKVVNPTSVPKLWQQLIVRTMVHKIEDEIQDPVEQISKLNDSMPKLSRGQSVSTYSLVSQDRLQSQCDKCTPDKILSREIAKSSTNLFEDSDVPSCSTCSVKTTTTNGNKYLTPNATNYYKKEYRSNSTF